MSISISGLSKSFGNQPVLNSISFAIEPGQIVGFLGPNGAGKTTTLRIISGSLGYSEGSVNVNGLEVRNHRLRTNALIGYLPENNPLYPEMYIREYLDLSAQFYLPYSQRKERIDALIERVGLGSMLSRKIAQLSKGYKQRVGLAQALIPDPKVLLLDEPTTGLDPNQLDEIRSLIRELGREKTILFSTHILQEVKALCDRALVIHQGTIVADLPQLNQKSHFRYEAEFLYPPTEEHLSALRNAGTVVALQPSNDAKLLIDGREDIREAIFDFAIDTGNKVLMLKPAEQDIEAIFKTMTQGSYSTNVGNI